MADRSVMYPFKIENGSVATTTLDNNALKSKVLFCVGTQIGERVMRPQWGIDIMQTVYMIGGEPEDYIPEAITAAFRKYFPKVGKVDVKVTRAKDDPTYVTAEVRYGQIGTAVDEIIRVSLPTEEDI